MIARHPGIEEITFRTAVRFDGVDGEFEVSLNLQEMHRLVVCGELPASIRTQHDIMLAAQAKKTEEALAEEDSQEE